MSEFKTIGIIGDGKMGQSIFRHLSKYDYNLVWINISSYKEESEKFKRKYKRLFSKEDFEKKINSVVISDSLAEIAPCNLIIEAVNEDINIKNNLFKELYLIANKNSIICSNTSSILPHRFTIDEGFRANFACLHFFYPVETNNLVEIIPTDKTTKNSVLKLAAFTKEISKVSFLQDKESAFAINRFFLEIQAGLFNYCIKNDIDFHIADKAIKNNIFPFGIFETMDFIGFNILEYSIQNYIDMHKNPEHIYPILNHIKNEKIKGSKDLNFLNYPLDNFDISDNEENKITEFLHNLISKTADKYLSKGVFNNLKDIELVISEYTSSDYKIKV